MKTAPGGERVIYNRLQRGMFLQIDRRCCNGQGLTDPPKENIKLDGLQ